MKPSPKREDVEGIVVNAENVEKIFAKARLLMKNQEDFNQQIPLIDLLRIYRWPEETIELALGKYYTEPTPSKKTPRKKK